MTVIQTPRLTLREIRESDFHALHRLRTDSDVTQHLDYIKSADEAETHQWIQDVRHHNQLHPCESYNLAIVCQTDGEIIGWIGIGKAEETRFGELAFGYALLPDYWGHGYAAEALAALITHIFTNHPISRIFGECDQQNVASARVMEKAGLNQRAPEHTDLIYEITRDDWLNWTDNPSNNT